MYWMHLLAPLVLEVDVDVGRLVALARDEALEQQRRSALRIHRGDAEAVAHRELAAEPRPWHRIPLLRARSDDVVDGEEVRLVAELGDQRELVLDERVRSVRDAARPAPARRPRRSGWRR